jgi:hypothetical protein
MFDNTLDMILSTPPNGLIERKSLISMAPAFFEIREIKVVLMLFSKFPQP